MLSSTFQASTTYNISGNRAFGATSLADTLGAKSDLEVRLGLERADLQKRDVQVKREFKNVARQKILLGDEWKKARLDRASLEEDRRRFETVRRSPWFQAALLPTSAGERVRLNVGGQVFETSKGVLSRDPDSLLHAIVSSNSPLEIDTAGAFYIDRDWWLFRHILRFLRDGRLPEDRELLSQLYFEADYYNLVTLRRAIRELLDPAHVVERTSGLSEQNIRRIETARGLGPPSTIGYGMQPANVRDESLYAPARALRQSQERDAYQTLRQSLDDISLLETKKAHRDRRDVEFAYGRKHYAAEHARRRRDDRWWTGAMYGGNDFKRGLDRLRTGKVQWRGRNEHNYYEDPTSVSRHGARTNSTWSTAPGYSPTRHGRIRGRNEFYHY